MKAIKTLAFCISAIGTSLGAGEMITLPSGQIIEFIEKRLEPEAGIVRLRFVSPDIASPLKRPSFEEMSTDLEALCTEFGLKDVLKNEPTPNQIVVSLSSEPIEFGISNAAIEQVFEAFSVENETCMLEMF